MKLYLLASRSTSKARINDTVKALWNEGHEVTNPDGKPSWTDLYQAEGVHIIVEGQWKNDNWEYYLWAKDKKLFAIYERTT